MYFNAIVPSIRRLLLTAILIFGSTQIISAQNRIITFSGGKTTLAQAMSQIETQTGKKFMYEADIVSLSAGAKLSSISLTLEEALTELFSGNGIDHMERGKYIILTRKPVEAPKPKPRPVVAPRTSDRYVSGNPNGAVGTWSERPKPEPEPEPEPEPKPEPEIIPEPEPVAVGEYPVPYSVYTDPDLYAPMRNKLPRLAVKINVLYGAATLTPNLAFEIGLNSRSTVEVSGDWNQWARIGTLEDNRKLNHYIVRGEYRWWTCERYNGHFFGLHAFYSQYNISDHDVLWIFDRESRYEGHAYGAGFTYGYHLALSRQWGIDFHVGVGAAHLKYDRFSCRLCDRPGTPESKTYFGPTRAGINLVFMFK